MNKDVQRKERLDECSKDVEQMMDSECHFMTGNWPFEYIECIYAFNILSISLFYDRIDQHYRDKNFIGYN